MEKQALDGLTAVFTDPPAAVETAKSSEAAMAARDSGTTPDFDRLNCNKLAGA